jgi:hypothetical protein
VTDSWAERPVASESADPRATPRPVPQAEPVTRTQTPAAGTIASTDPFARSVLISDDMSGDPPATPTAAARVPAAPAEAKRSSLRRTQWLSAPAEEAVAGSGSPVGPSEGAGDGSAGRGRQAGLVLVGTLAVLGLLFWVIASTLPNSGPKPSSAGSSVAPSPTLQPLGASPLAVVGNRPKAGSSATPTPALPK